MANNEISRLYVNKQIRSKMDTIQTTQSFFDSNTIAIFKDIIIPFLLSLIVAIIGGIIVHILWSKHVEKKKQKEDDKRKKLEIDTYFADYLDKGKIYIPMIVKESHSKQKFPFFEHFIEIIQKRPVKSRYICLLGDIGSGKTATLTRLHQWYIDKYSHKSSMPSYIKLYTLNKGYSEFMQRISDEIPKKDRGNCILLLDALDECEEARATLENTPENNPRVFMERLARDTDSFAWVVVSCRKQFFQREELKPKSEEEENPQDDDFFFQNWHRLYLEPFDHEQVEAYLNEHFGIGPNPLKEEAQRLVFSSKEVFLRPLILTYIDVILEEYRNKKVSLSMKDVYDTIIYQWIIREAKKNKVKPQKLLGVSLLVAAYMYKNNLTYLNDENYQKMCEEYGIDDPDNLLLVESLLTNDEEKGFRFVHKSFYEHLLAYRFFLNPDDINSLQGLLESTLPTYVEIKNEEKGNEGGLSKLLETGNVDGKTRAAGLHNIGFGLDNLCHYNEAEPFYQEALKIYRELVKKDRDTYLSYVANTLNNLANLHTNTNRHDEAEKEYQEALDYYRKLAKNNPDAYMPDMAMTLNNLAILHKNTNRHEEAENEYQEALKIRRELADKNPDAYQTDVAMTLNNLAILHKNTNRHEEAENEYQEALKIRRELADKNPDAYLSDVAMTLFNIAILQKDKGELADAEKTAQESLKLYKQMAEISHAAFDEDVKDAEKLLKLIHEEIILQSAKSR